MTQLNLLDRPVWNALTTSQSHLAVASGAAVRMDPDYGPFAAARAKNVGWRIDYQFATPSLRPRLRDCSIHPEPRFSDHAPYVVDYAP